MSCSPVSLFKDLECNELDKSAKYHYFILALSTLIERNRRLVFRKNSLSLKDTSEYKLSENVAAVCNFILYVDELGFKLSGANLAKIESALVETFVRPTILAGAEMSGEISNVLETIQAMAKDISVEFVEVERVSNKLGELIENAKLAESLAQARTIATNAKPLILDTVIPQNDERNNCSSFDTLNLSGRDQNFCKNIEI